jgi:hypothetical protein
LGLVAAWLALYCGQAPAQGVERVLMPGPVIEGHAKYEDECRNCHVPFSRTAQNELCLACHKETAVDVRHEKGFHGRLKPQPCRTCHTDHKGRGARIAPLDEAAFDHKQTDFPLQGAHGNPKTVCKSCHVPGKKFREAPGRCNDCHAKKDVHKGRLGTACADCHSENDWKEILLDHDKTRFPLRGKHAPPLKCESCHKDTRYKETPSTCIGCHKKEDKHEATLGEKCADCHTERDWKASKFDHDKTEFRLRGGHVAPKAKCDACHRDQKSYRKTPTDCQSCHERDDVHKGQQGKKCESCHDDDTWKKARFDHARARFPLVGGHLVVACAKCHATQRYKDAKSECIACHDRDDVHKRRLGTRCEPCHNARTWKSWDFNHDRQTKYPLDGAHRKLDCYACHRQPVQTRATLPTSCVSCHAADDVHDGSYGRQCEKCHITDSFKRIKQRVGMSGFAGLLACETPASRVLHACGEWASRPVNHWEH